MDGFPAHFCAEGLDQTRGWFYTLVVLFTYLFDKPAFDNLDVNGLVLAEDGKKMSKRLKNYPDPTDVRNKHGADTVRLYMRNSPVMRAEPLEFREDGVRDVVKDVFLPWYNAYRFLIQEVGRYEGSVGKFEPDAAALKKSDNINVMLNVNVLVAPLTPFVTELMYQNLSRALMQFRAMILKENGIKLQDVFDKLKGIEPLLGALDFMSWLKPILPRSFMVTDSFEEYALPIFHKLGHSVAFCNCLEADDEGVMARQVVRVGGQKRLAVEEFQRLSEGHAMKAKSVHFAMIPEVDAEALSPGIMTAMGRMQAIDELGRTSREQRKVGVKIPLENTTVMNNDQGFIKEFQTLAVRQGRRRPLRLHHRLGGGGLIRSCGTCAGTGTAAAFRMSLWSAFPTYSDGEALIRLPEVPVRRHLPLRLCSPFRPIASR